MAPKTPKKPIKKGGGKLTPAPGEDYYSYSNRVVETSRAGWEKEDQRLITNYAKKVFRDQQRQDMKTLAKQNKLKPNIKPKKTAAKPAAKAKKSNKK